ncbi:MAG: DUF1949 domain-containing protein [Oscillospiraceae bacterium]
MSSGSMPLRAGLSACSSRSDKRSAAWSGTRTTARMIELTILLPLPEEAAFRKALQELSAGSLAPETTGTELRGVRIR